MEPVCPACGSTGLETIPIEGNYKKSMSLMYASIACLILAGISFMAIMYHLIIAISLSVAFLISWGVLIHKADKIKMTELRCQSCGWSSLKDDVDK